MYYLVTIPDYDTENRFVQFSVNAGSKLLTFTFNYYEGDWVCKIYNITDDEYRSFTLRSNATYFNYDPVYSVLFGEIPEIDETTISGLIFEVRDNAA